MRVLGPDEIGLCNCAAQGCGRELLGDRTAKMLATGEAVTDAPLPPPVAEYVKGRPICSDCQRSRLASDKEEVAKLRRGRVPTGQPIRPAQPARDDYDRNDKAGG